MKLEQIYTGCIAEAAYYITSEGEAAIVDPLRETQPYLERLERDGVKLKYIFETHFHADFVSGHVDLAHKTGATIVYGPTSMKTGFEIHLGYDGEIFELGGMKIKLIHTPGHTMESSCFLLIDEDDEERGIITGDTLFIGDVGRPDLAQHVIADLTQDKLARHLYHSLRDKIMPLSDDLMVYPNHGAGSACGKMMSKETTDTLGNQKKTNYALNPKLSEDEFVAAVLKGLTTPPQYFPKNVLMNIQGYESLDDIMQRGQRPYDVKTFEEIANQTMALVLDTRKASEFAKGFIPNSINIGLESNFAMWVGELIPDLNQQILIVAENEEKVQETIIRLSRVGYDHAVGYLEGGFEAWVKAGKETDMVNRITADDLVILEEIHETPIFDVRKQSEFESEHIVGAINIPLNQISDYLTEFPRDRYFVIHCAGGYRSMIAASILKQRGFENFADVIGGFNEIKLTDMPLTAYVCPTTLL
ncbi:MBL fold metallo-hydrolase [Flavobacterium silvisoli]|uniref:MBL fold metallo-hydrolase n=1 Tax=Flavobacterium silvisoli TaxID=2529433 RepID=A0A4Q9Z4P0_9FLAO|nr:MBL fold metallo-hydrolase [Flavobacterium silvisoli]TBX70346.1 MBL fold metallo-hydrolase [Flavobacterium silvisoli]